MIARSQMLYECWSEVVRERSNQPALRHPDVPGGWTFSDLDRRAGDIELPASGYAIARGDTLDYFPTILAAWKNKLPVLILESRDSRPRPIHGNIPEGTALIKQTCGAPGVERSLFFGPSQVLAEGLRNTRSLELNPDHRSIAAISLAHSYGFGCLALPLLLAGIPIDIVPSPLPVFIQEALAKDGAFFLPSVPAIWKTWWLTKALDGSSISLALSAGAPLSLDLENGVWNDTGTKLHNFYGTTETGAVAFDRSTNPRTDASLIGDVLDGVDVTTLNQERIAVHTDAQATGSDVELRENEFNSPHYLTMDVGQVVDDKQLHWHDHVGMAINVAGRKVSPEKIKRVCLTTPGILEARVFGTRSRDFERFEEVSVAISIEANCDLKQIKTAIYNRLDSWEVPRHWEVNAENSKS
ncbi:MAG: AMP-binding protein [Verrucomicrobiae bacterium]|nr:AMP-binding protein [Verrucomicrobiae bacterium]NNJ85943.1 AMP-binding protein [Akkermansiaceae bacterium]